MFVCGIIYIENKNNKGGYIMDKAVEDGRKDVKTWLKWLSTHELSLRYGRIYFQIQEACEIHKTHGYGGSLPEWSEEYGLYRIKFLCGQLQEIAKACQ